MDLGKPFWDWVQTDLTWSLVGESVPFRQLSLILGLVQPRTHVALPEIDLFCYILFSVMLLRIEILLPHSHISNPSFQQLL